MLGAAAESAATLVEKPKFTTWPTTTPSCVSRADRRLACPHRKPDAGGRALRPWPAWRQSAPSTSVYAPGSPQRFFLFHRKRPGTTEVAGWAGSASAANGGVQRLAARRRETATRCVSSDTAGLPPQPFLSSLDADTQLPREAARRGRRRWPTAHRRRFDAAQGRVVEGYAVHGAARKSQTCRRQPLALRALVGRSAGAIRTRQTVLRHRPGLFGAATFTGKGHLRRGLL